MGAIQLRPELEDRIRQRVQNGQFKSVEDAVDKVLDSFLDLEEYPFASSPNELNRLLQKGLESAAAGDVVDGEKAFEELRLEGLRRQGKLP